MSDLTVTFARMFGSMFVPNDNLTQQARQYIAETDVDGDGVINLNDPAQRKAMDVAHLKGFELADSLGRQNGVVSLRELRNGLGKYDTSGSPNGGPDGALDGLEWLNILRDAAKMP